MASLWHGHLCDVFNQQYALSPSIGVGRLTSQQSLSVFVKLFGVSFLKQEAVNRATTLYCHRSSAVCFSCKPSSGSGPHPMGGIEIEREKSLRVALKYFLGWQDWR